MNKPTYGVAVLADPPARLVRASHITLYGHRFVPGVGVARVCWDATIEYEDGGTRTITGGMAVLGREGWRVHMPAKVLVVDGEQLAVRVHLPHGEYLSVRNAILDQLNRGDA